MDQKKVVQQQFGKSAASYVTSPIHKDGKDLQKLVKLASINGQEEVLDIATGGGHTANGFAPFVKKVIALDLTSEMLVAAEKFIKGNGHQNVEFIQGDAEKLPFLSASIDIVTCRIAPHHFQNVKKFVEEAFRVLRSSGQFLLIDNVAPEDNELDYFYNQIEKKRDYSHFRAWKKTEWMSLLELEGFEINELHRFEKTFQFDSWCNRMKLPPSEKADLIQYIINSSQKVKEKFRIVHTNQTVTSFQGESVIIKASKR
ncbi:class I SAM-dependent methyltransferase [Bacillus sp. EB600]|uniref:class I SAM-dependent methyltransferase n=1 Tax=Bacillus sp. EB600 TaxID=2806345 RepID=UPI00210CD2EF|nr:class I SAM-dependent methyltransferase [Bacillus sp. EB600]MCQ6280348.1 class I SAM-dependent methyltransferase [Bacillus sp. EB600]